MKRENQLSLGELIVKLEQTPHFDNSGKEKEIYFDFCHFSPTTVKSFRSSENELAIGYAGIDLESDKEKNPILISEFLNMLRNAIGNVFHGYKSGEYLMSTNTPLWVSKWGEHSRTSVSGVIDCGYYITLCTSHCEH